MKQSKLLLLVFLLCLSLCIFAACAQEETPADDPGTEEGSSEASGEFTVEELLQNKDFRLALNYALDREEYVAVASSGLYYPGTRFVLPLVAGAETTYAEEYPMDVYQSTADLELAQQHLTAAMETLGISDPSEITIKIKISDDEGNRPIAENCQDQWNRNLGINVEIETVTYRAMLDDRVAGNFELIYAGWMPDYDDPYTYLSYFVSTNAQNGGKFSNERYDELVNTANTYSDKATRLAMYAEAEQILLEEAGIVPLQVRQRPWAYANNLKGIVRYYLGPTVDYIYAYFDGQEEQDLSFSQTDIPTIDPQLFNASASYVAIKGYSEGLVHTLGAEVRPGVAESWEIADDNMSMTFHLRQDACWSDGSPLTANDFVYAFRRLADPNTAASYSWVLSEVKNATAVLAGEMAVEDLGVSAPDDYTFVIEFDVPAPYYLSFLDMPPFHPVKQELVEQYGVDYASSADTLLGNGPFVITEYLVDQSITMVPNENYWDRESIKLDSVTIHVMDQDAAFDLMRTGELDLADIPVDVANSYLEDASLLPDHTAELFMDGAVDWFCINMSGSTTGANN